MCDWYVNYSLAYIIATVLLILLLISWPIFLAINWVTFDFLWGLYAGRCSQSYVLTKGKDISIKLIGEILLVDFLFVLAIWTSFLDI